MRVWAIPLAAFALLALFLVRGLELEPQTLPSPLIGKRAPAFELARVDDATRSFSPEQMRGKVWLLNVWASWCGPCRTEHPLLVQFARQGAVPLVGLNYTDKLDASRKWLADFGDPYVATAFDGDGKVGMDYGVYGVPETYVIDKRGVIRYKHVGPLSRKTIDERLLPLIKELNDA